ncbi:YfeC-like transcriptional regulator [Pseudocitrobacter cyperus]|uniref:YfeC-like transcriptional regulator n=1 Tax=Pseudocitrobacter cyperus TaxID=3112843 RepID=A0ABV0HNF2_9ENTR
MKKLKDKMSTDELARCLGMTRQTINRWIREQSWQTEPMPGVKGGRARLVHITPQVRAYLANTPALLEDDDFNTQIAEPAKTYSAKESDVLWQQISDTLQVMTPAEMERLNVLLRREGICGFLSRLGIASGKTA